MASVLPSEVDSTQRKSYITYTLPSLSPESAFWPGAKTSLQGGSEADGEEVDEEREHAILGAERSITLLESRSVISAASNTGQRTWEAALHLVAYLASEDGVDDNTDRNSRLVGNRVRGKHVLELGAGTGLVSIVCARYLGAQLVLATDGDEGVVEALKTNLSLNGLDVDSDIKETNSADKQTGNASKKTDGGSMACRVRAKLLRWGLHLHELSFDKFFEDAPPDLVVAADVVSVLLLSFVDWLNYLDSLKFQCRF